MILGYTDHLIHTWHMDTCHLVINQHVGNNKLISNLLPLKSQDSHLWSLELVFYLYWNMFYAIFNQHLDLVSGMGAFVCEWCGKEFTVRTNLTRHQKSHKMKHSPVIHVTLLPIQNEVWMSMNDLENKIYSDKSTFQTNKRKRKLAI